MRRYAKFGVPLALLVAAVASGLACGDDDDAPNSPGASVTTSVPTISAAPQPTTEVDPATGLPITFPDDFPVYQPTSVSRASDFGDRFVIQWRTPDPVATVADFYATALETSPWSIEEVTQEGEGSRITFAASGFSGELAVATIGEETQVLLNLGIEE